MRKPLLLLLLSLPLLCGAKNFDMWVIDVEGGKALLLVSPSRQAMLIDTGNPGFEGRDTNRIMEAAGAAGVKKIDVLVTTHYDADHVNNTPEVAARLPVALFVDHGPVHRPDPRMQKAVDAYLELVGKAKRMVAKPGDKVPFAGVDTLVVASDGKWLEKPLKGAGKPNPACAATQQKKPDPTENAYCVGLLFTYGKFRMVDFGDLSWNKEIELMCPNNPIGRVDLLMTSYHGGDPANSPALVHGLSPKVTIMDNSVKKMGSAGVVQTIKKSPGLQAAYQLHWSANASNDNPPDEFIANLQNSPDGKWIKVSAEKNGKFTVTNARTGAAKTFR